MKYALKLSRHWEQAFDPATAEPIDDFKRVTVRTLDGREKEWKVGKTILEDEEMWTEFRLLIIHPWVEERLVQ